VYTFSLNYDIERTEPSVCSVFFIRRERDDENQSDHLLGSKSFIGKDKKQQAC